MVYRGSDVIHIISIIATVLKMWLVILWDYNSHLRQDLEVIMVVGRAVSDQELTETLCVSYIHSTDVLYGGVDW